MRVVLLPADESACGLYRMKFPAGAVARHRSDWQVEVYRPSDIKLGTGPDGLLWAVYGIPEPDKIDVLVVQRVATSATVQLLRWASSKGIATVLDADDAMWAIDPENVSWAAWNGKQANWRWLERAAAEADLVTTTTPALAHRYGKHGRVEVLPNCIPGEALTLDSIREEFDPRPTVGWAGFTSTHPRDLQVMGEAMLRLTQITDTLVRVVGDGPGAAREWGLERSAVEQVGPVQIGVPYLTALTSLDVGVVPLQPTPFNRAKSALKMLEYRAMGLRVVASPTPDNQRVAALDEHVVLASSPDEWLHALCDALSAERPAPRAIPAEHSYEERWPAWAAAWERAYTRRSRLSA